MDLKEMGACAVVVIGGVAYGVSSGGLKDALSDDVRYVYDVHYDERADYMLDIVADFEETFGIYIIQTESYDFVGESSFSTSPAKAMFVETVTSQERVPSEEIDGIRKQTQTDFCAQEEMQIFTEKGWRYKFTLTNDNGGQIFSTVCKPDPSKFQTTNKPIG